IDGIVEHQRVLGRVAGRALAGGSRRLRIDPSIRPKIVDPERIAARGGNRIATAADVDALAPGIVTSGGIDPERRLRSFGADVLPLVRRDVVKPDVAAAVREERLLACRQIDQGVAKAAGRRRRTGSQAVPPTGAGLEQPGTGIRRRLLPPAFALRQRPLFVAVWVGHAHETLAVAVVGRHLVAVGHGSDWEWLAAWRRFKTQGV